MFQRSIFIFSSLFSVLFGEQAINLETLQMLSESDLKELVPIIGHRAKLSAQIKLIKTITSGEATDSMEICEDLQCTEPCGSVTFFIESPPTELQIQEKEENITPDTSCELYRILRTTNDGKSLLSKHKDAGLLNNADRRRLCNVIIAHELKDDPQKKLTSSRLYELAYDIPKIFNKENSSVYFIPYTTITTKHKISAKGKLLDCYRQRRREFIKSGVISEYSKRQPSTSSSNPGSPQTDTSSNIQDALEQLKTLTEDVEDKIVWLQNCCDPWETVDTYWDITAKQRLKELASNETTVEEYLRKYKALNQPGGVFLLLKDFKTLYPYNDGKLHQNWPLLRPKIIDYARKRQDSGLKAILNIVENDGVTSLRDVKLLVEPTTIIRGGTAALICSRDMQDAPLYSVKWYRGNHEFYRYTPLEEPSTRVFSIPGIYVDVNRSNGSQVLLRRLDLGMAGNYSCEVTADSPSFATQIAHKFVDVVALPVKDPLLKADKDRYSPGEILRANCSSSPARPAANLTIYVNEEPLRSSETGLHPSDSGLQWTSVYADLKVTPDLFPGGRLRVACVASIYEVYKRSATLDFFTPETDPRPERITLNGCSATRFPSWIFLFLLLLLPMVVMGQDYGLFNEDFFTEFYEEESDDHAIRSLVGG